MLFSLPRELVAALTDPCNSGGNSRARLGATERFATRWRLFDSEIVRFGVASIPSPALCGERVGARELRPANAESDLATASPLTGLHRTMLRIAEAFRPLPAKSGARLRKLPLALGSAWEMLFRRQAGIGIAMLSLIERTVSVTIRQSDSEPIASAAATVSCSRVEATRVARLSKPGAGRPGHGLLPRTAQSAATSAHPSPRWQYRGGQRLHR